MTGRPGPRFAVADGLAHRDVKAILQDRQGHFWFGTEGGGASQFDGKTWTNYTDEHGLAHNYVRAINEDRQGHLWFGTKGGGVNRLAGRPDRVK